MAWEDFGVRLPSLIAGLSGGVVNSIAFNRTEPRTIVGAVIVGALTANYLEEAVIKLIGTPQGATAFIIGLAGMVICKKLVDRVKNYRLPSLGGGDAS